MLIITFVIVVRRIAVKNSDKNWQMVVGFDRVKFNIVADKDVQILND